MNSGYNRDFVSSLIGDGRPLLSVTAIALILSGGFALFLSATGHFLPHDIQFLGMTSKQLCGFNQCKVVHFMFHDRVSFGGAIMAIGLLYLWLVEFPIKNGERWGWWAFVLSSVVGFASFLTYLGYGYFDSWHGVATLFLLLCTIIGLQRTYKRCSILTPLIVPVKNLINARCRTREGAGRLCFVGIAFGTIFGGLTISLVGMTSVFVPQDLTFLGLKTADLFAVNPRLVPLIAHDRAGFGGAVCSCGTIILLVSIYGRACRSLWQVLLYAGLTGFGTAIGIHPIIGYNNVLHLAPAVLGLFVFIFGIALLRKPFCGATETDQHAKSVTPIRATAEHS